jgi:glyoxylase-like metal-dependent hydrolase (beta-lactamase superfamily II)
LGVDALKNLPGWRLLGAFPDHEPDGVGAWLLHNDGEALLLEIPPGLTVNDVAAGLASIGAGLRYVTASHLHEDHLNIDGWNELQEAFHGTHFMRPTEAKVGSDILINLGGEPLWLIKAPKHSPSDTVTVFRGVAMTGDLELGTLDSVNREVSRATKAASMDYLRGFEDRTGCRVHTIVSAHLNDFRQGVNWRGLFEVG